MFISRSNYVVCSNVKNRPNPYIDAMGKYRIGSIDHTNYIINQDVGNYLKYGVKYISRTKLRNIITPTKDLLHKNN